MIAGLIVHQMLGSTELGLQMTTCRTQFSWKLLCRSLVSTVAGTSPLDKDNLLFRNLDATATLVKDIDLRNKTIVNTTAAKSYSMLG